MITSGSDSTAHSPFSGQQGKLGNHHELIGKIKGMTKLNSKALFEIADEGNKFEVCAGRGLRALFIGDEPRFLAVCGFFNIAEKIIRGHDLSEEEQLDLAEKILIYAHEHVATDRNKIRKRFLLPVEGNASETVRRYITLHKELKAAIKKLAADYLKLQNSKAAPVAANVTDTHRTGYLDDDFLFPKNMVRLRDKSIDKLMLLEKLREITDRTVFQDFSGEEFHLFLKIYELWFRNKRPTEIKIERGAFLAELGIHAQSGALQGRIKKIIEILTRWSEQEAFRIIADKSETGGLNFSGMCYLPRWRQTKAKAIGEAIIWTFSDFDKLLFSESGRQYHKIATRPFALLTEALGGTAKADLGKHALGVILTELVYRKNPFKISLATLKLTIEDFSRNTDLRQNAIDAVIGSLAKIGIGINFEAGHVLINPKKGGEISA